MQFVFAAMMGVLMAMTIVVLARHRRLTFRYTVGWLFLSTFGTASGLLIPLVNPISAALQISPAALLGISALFVLTAICIQLSISISGIQNQIRRLAEEIALLRLDYSTHEPNREND